nr:hypothetical protein [Nocardiopsis gilva]
MPPLPDQVQVEVAEDGQVPVGVVDQAPLHLSGIAHEQPVVGHSAGVRSETRVGGQRRGEDAVVQVVQLDGGAVGQHGVHRFRQGAQGAHGGPVRAGVRPEQSVRIVVRAADEAVDLCVVEFSAVDLAHAVPRRSVVNIRAMVDVGVVDVGGLVWVGWVPRCRGSCVWRGWCARGTRRGCRFIA